MAGMPWIKIYTEMLDDPKIAKVSEVTKWRFIQLILVAAECDAGGAFVVGDDVMTIDDIAWRLRMDKDTLEVDIKVLLKAGILSMDGKVLEIPKFAERQGPTQKEKRETWKNRQQKRRERVTRESQESHALEEEEDKSRGDEDKPEPPPQIFVTGDLLPYHYMFQNETGVGEYVTSIGLEVFSKMKAAGVTPEDMRQGIHEMQHAPKQYTIISPKSVENAAYSAKNNREYRANKNQPEKPKTFIDVLADGTQVIKELADAS